MNREELQKVLKPIIDGLFGRQGMKCYECPHLLLRSLNRMLGDLAAIEPVEWFRYVLSRESPNGEFTDEQRYSQMEQALACGQEYARKVMEEYKNFDSKMIAKAISMKVSYPTYLGKMDRVFSAEYWVPDTICIYMGAVKKTKKFLEKPGVREILTEGLNTSGLSLAYELFHNVEEKHRHKIYIRTEEIRLWSLGPVHNDSIITALSEIVVMAFAKEIASIPYAPYVMDVFFVYGYFPEEASGLYEEMMKFARLEPCVPEQVPDLD